MTAPVTVTLTEVQPQGSGITFALIDDSTYTPATASSTGGWQIVDRPRLVAVSQWYDRSPMSITADLLLDSNTVYGNNVTSVEGLCLQVDGWQDKAPGALQPVVLSITGPVPGIQHQWVMQNVSFGKAIRDPVAGFRIQQALKVVLYEYNSALVTTTTGPAQTAQQALAAAEAAESYTLYVVVTGDTLQSIAATLLGDFTRWIDIANLNAIRDPGSIVPGQIIKIPQGT